MRQQHKLFKTHPLDGEFQLGDETVTSPYHIYNGSMLLIGGRANADVAKTLLKHEQLTPILDQDGNALMALWICNFTEANLGSHHELQFSIFASYQPHPPVKTHPFAIYHLLMLDPDAMMVCHGLWNSTEKVVRYNQEHLMLDARVCHSTIDIDNIAKQWHFNFTDADTQQALLSGQINLPKQQPPSALFDVFRHLGFGGMIKTIRGPFVEVPVVNTISPYATENRIARTYTHSDAQLVTRFGTDSGHLMIKAPQYQGLQFQPDFIQNNNGVKFVYKRPIEP